MIETTQGRADLHVHTTFSDGLVSPQELLDAAEAQGLDVLAVTDHDTIEGAEAVRTLATEQGRKIKIITGIEVTASRGMHILGLFVEAPIKMFQSVEYVVEAITAQGGMCLAPHPLSPLTPSLGRRSIDRLLSAGKPLLAVETANPSPAGRIVQQKVAACNGDWQLAEFGGSDAHFVQHVGIAYTEFPGQSVDDLRSALLSRKTEGCFSPHPVGFVPPTDYVRQLHRSMIQIPATKVVRALRRMRKGD